MNNEIIPDEFLANDADCPVFGLNLACAYPFPASVEDSYSAMAKRLADLDDAVYVYPIWETHVTIMTFVNFSLHRRPSAERLEELRSLIEPVTALVEDVIDRGEIEPFRLEFQPPVLTPKAVILPITNPTGEINRIRQFAAKLLEGRQPLSQTLLKHGLNVPGIIHSTVLRFTRPVREYPRFASQFNTARAGTSPWRTTVGEVLLTTETKPYMRAGEILRRFSLTGLCGGI